MSTISLRQTEMLVNLTSAALIAAALKAEAPANRSLHRALDKVLLQVERGRTFTLRPSGLRVQSSWHDWLEYDVTPHGCICAAERGICWHRALFTLLRVVDCLQSVSHVEPLHPAVSMAREVPAVNPWARKSYDDVLNASDELY